MSTRTPPQKLTDHDLISVLLRLASSEGGSAGERYFELRQELLNRLQSQVPDREYGTSTGAHAPTAELSNYELVNWMLQAATAGEGMLGDQYLEEVKKRMGLERDARSR